MTDSAFKCCIHCNQPLPLSHFGLDRSSLDSLSRYCKLCKNAIGRANYTPKAHIALPDGMKRCSVCKELKPATLEYFHSNPTNTDGLRSACKPCRNILDARNAYLNRESPMTEKRCPVCEQTKSAEAFSRAKSRYDGRMGRCKECVNRLYAIAHPMAVSRQNPLAYPDGYKECTCCHQAKPATSEYFNKKLNTFTSMCKPCLSARRKNARQFTREYEQWRYTAKREQILATHRQYRHNHPELFKESAARYRASHREQCRVRARNWHIAHLEYAHQRNNCYHKQYYREHSDYCKMLRHQRRARLKAVPGTYTTQQIAEMLKRQKYRCYYAACGHAKFEKRNGKYAYHVEHTIPLSRTDCQPRNDISHLVLACPTCNLKKGTKLPHEWFEGGRLL